MVAIKKAPAHHSSGQCTSQSHNTEDVYHVMVEIRKYSVDARSSPEAGMSCADVSVSRQLDPA